MKKGKRKSILAKLLSCVMVLQVAASFGASSYAAESESGTSVTPIFNPDYAQLIGPVSYTHLDVYKRQYQACMPDARVRSPKNHERRTDLPSAGGFSVYDWKCRG